MTGHIHDHACQITASITKSLVEFIRDEETRDVFEAVYELVKSGIERYEVIADRLHRRIHPSKH